MWRLQHAIVRRSLGAAAVLLLLVTGRPGSSSAETQDGLTIPETHPRLWWVPAERLTRARQWFAANRFKPRSDDALGNAFVYLMTGNLTYARAAITRLMGFKVPENELEGTASNTYRWHEWPPIVFDWCYEAMTQQERDDFTARYNRYADIIRQKGWGGLNQPSSNYYWGYLRNELNWAIASYHHNPMAPTFLDHALIARWENSFAPWASGGGKGGVPNEGSQYGRYMLGYPVMPLVSAGLLGRDVFGETNFHKEAIFYLIYTTTPAPTQRSSTATPKYEIFPFSDDEFWKNGGSAEWAAFGDLLTVLANQWSHLPVGQYARRWLNVVTPSRSEHVRAVDPGSAERSFAALPLDYYAPGSIAFMFMRNAWSSQATSIHLHMGIPSGGASHRHQEAGTFQIRRGAKWVSRQTVGYADDLAGYGGAVVRANHTAAHNGILFNGKGLAHAYMKGPPVVTRLESRASYAYAAVDLSKAYRAYKTPRPERDDNPYAAHIEREFVFVRPLETLVVFDRLESTSEVIPAEEVVKTFLAHFEQPPQIDGSNSVLGINGDQALRLITLLPRTPTYRVVWEGDFPDSPSSSMYQHRLEVDTKGSRQSYFLHVLQARDALGADVLARLDESADAYTVTLEHPTRGKAVVVFAKGMVSVGGGVGYSASGLPASVTPLITQVQGIAVTDNGPVWDGAAPPAPTDTNTLPPSVSLTAPADADTVFGTVTVIAAASDDEGVAHVQFLLDGAPIGLDATNTYSVSWDTTTISSGTHTLTAVATDLDGQQSVSSPVTVTVDNAPPVIAKLAVANVTADAATVTWTTDEPADSVVEYGITTAYGSAVGDGALVTSHGSSLAGLAPQTLYHYRVRSADRLGNAAVSGDGTFTTTAPPSLIFLETGGQVVVETEHYAGTIARNGQDWVLKAAQGGFSGAGYLEALPNTGANLDIGYVTGSPELVYTIQFTTPGTYSVWIRGYAASDTEDSLHAGLDGVGPASADRIGLSAKDKWAWTRTTMDSSAPATLVISAPGLHTIHLWMREDGFKVDKILLRTSSSSTAPSGSGQAESPRVP